MFANLHRALKIQVFYEYIVVTCPSFQIDIKMKATMH